MKELLLSEIKSDTKDLLQTLVLIEESIFDQCSVDILPIKCSDHSLDGLEIIITQCQAVIAEIDSSLEQAEVLLNELYFQHLFIDNYRDFWPLDAYKVSTSLNSRLMSPIIKAAFVVEIIAACGFDADIVFVPSKAMIRICCDEKYAIIFDPITGESLHWHELDLKLDELGGDPGQDELPSMSQQAILIEYLTAFKNALIREKLFDKALNCVDILVLLNPDDPLQRRDRGFLLHQLDCFKVAVDDYRYFVEKCPKDPAAQLLKLQLDNISLSDTVFH
ncbi:MAG: tetratricopeptide repeat protein [Colwellia sp.]